MLHNIECILMVYIQLLVDRIISLVLAFLLFQILWWNQNIVLYQTILQH